MFQLTLERSVRDVGTDRERDRTGVRWRVEAEERLLPHVFPGAFTASRTAAKAETARTSGGSPEAFELAIPFM